MKTDLLSSLYSTKQGEFDPYRGTLGNHRLLQSQMSSLLHR